MEATDTIPSRASPCRVAKRLGDAEAEVREEERVSLEEVLSGLRDLAAEVPAASLTSGSRPGVGFARSLPQDLAAFWTRCGGQAGPPLIDGLEVLGYQEACDLFCALDEEVQAIGAPWAVSYEEREALLLSWVDGNVIWVDLEGHGDPQDLEAGLLDWLTDYLERAAKGEYVYSEVLEAVVEREEAEEAAAEAAEASETLATDYSLDDTERLVDLVARGVAPEVLSLDPTADLQALLRVSAARLTSFVWRRVRLDQQFWSWINTAPNLQRLILHDCELEGIVCARALEELGLTGSSWTEDVEFELYEIEHLDLADCERGPELAERLALRCRELGLQQVNLQFTGVTEEDPLYLAFRREGVEVIVGD